MTSSTTDSNKTKFEIAKQDGVAKIYADKAGSTQVYMGNTGKFDEDVFNVSYGHNSHIDYEAKKEGSLNFFQTEGSPINYHSGSQSGRSTRIDTYPCKGMWDNDTDFSWKDNPGYLYNKKGIKNGEFTTFIRVHGSLGTHTAYAHKVGGRDQDAIRSLAEMVYPTSGKDSVAFNYNYAHFPYVHAKARTFQDLESFDDNWGWLALKTIHIVKDDYTHWEMWADFDPIAKDGKINNNWEKIAEYKDEGCDEYENVPVSWSSHKEVCRVDGFKRVDFALFSDREIDPTKLTSNQKPVVKPAKVEQSRPVVDDKQNDNSVEDVQAAMNFIRTNPKIALEVLSKIPSLQPFLPKPTNNNQPKGKGNSGNNNGGNNKKAVVVEAPTPPPPPTSTNNTTSTVIKNNANKPPVNSGKVVNPGSAENKG